MAGGDCAADASCANVAGGEFGGGAGMGELIAAGRAAGMAALAVP